MYKTAIISGGPIIDGANIAVRNTLSRAYDSGFLRLRKAIFFVVNSGGAAEALSKGILSMMAIPFGLC